MVFVSTRNFSTKLRKREALRTLVSGRKGSYL
jgi:hypothetical protein